MSNNLDVLINKIGFEIVNEKILEENQINKMLGVLANDGVYAWWVYTKKELDWKFIKDENKFKSVPLIKLMFLLKEFEFLFNEKIMSNEIIKQICQKQEQIERKKSEKKTKDKNRKKEVEKEINNLSAEQNKLINNFFINLSENLNNLLFFREILEKILTYARYHAKAMGD